MSTVEGFFVESGLYLKCPHCKNSTRQNVQSLFLSIQMDKPVTCTKCEKEFTIHVELRPVVEAVEQLRAPDEATGCAHRAVAVAGSEVVFCEDCGKTLRR